MTLVSPYFPSSLPTRIERGTGREESSGWNTDRRLDRFVRSKGTAARGGCGPRGVWRGRLGPAGAVAGVLIGYTAGRSSRFLGIAAFLAAFAGPANCTIERGAQQQTTGSAVPPPPAARATSRRRPTTCRRFRGLNSRPRRETTSPSRKLTRRANHRHIVIIARIKPRRETGRGLFASHFESSFLNRTAAAFGTQHLPMSAPCRKTRLQARRRPNPCVRHNERIQHGRVSDIARTGGPGHDRLWEAHDECGYHCLYCVGIVKVSSPIFLRRRRRRTISSWIMSIRRHVNMFHPSSCPGLSRASTP